MVYTLLLYVAKSLKNTKNIDHALYFYHIQGGIENV